MNKLTVLLVDDHEGFINAAMRHFRKIDWLQIVGSAGNDTLSGGTAAKSGDFNQVDYGAGTAALTINLGVTDSLGTVTSTEFGTDSLQFIDRIFGGAGADVARAAFLGDGPQCDGGT